MRFQKFMFSSFFTLASTNLKKVSWLMICQTLQLSRDLSYILKLQFLGILERLFVLSQNSKFGQQRQPF